MGIEHERRSGKDRRQSFLIGLDRRQSSGKHDDRRLNSSAGDLELANGPDKAKAEANWGAYGDIQPIE